MRAVVLEDRNQREYLLLAGSVVLSIVAHLSLATGVSRIEIVEPCLLYTSDAADE